MFANELRKKSEKDLKETLSKLTKEMEDLTKDILQNKEKNVKKLGAIKKDIARIKTVMVEKKDK